MARKIVNLSASERAFAEARELIPGGVNSPVRAFAAVGGRPPFIKSGKGSSITDIDGNSYIDYVCSWGPLILGHCDAAVVAAIKAAAELGSSFGAPTLGEIELARMITQAYPSVERVRLVNSGTEATMSAIRVARGFTGRRMIVKFEGCYHGHADGLLVKAGSGAATFGTPTSLGVPEDYAKLTICLPFNDIDAVARTCESLGRDVACIIVEPVVGNMGVVPPKPGYLEGLREITARHGIVLVFDEVMTGFRVAYGGAQELYGIRPDLTTLGKIIGGGLPVGAYGGRADIMDFVAPTGKVYQAGTLSGNPLAVAAGLATLRKLHQPGFYEKLERSSARLAAGLESAFRSAGVSVCINRVGSMICPFFTGGPVNDYAAASRADTARFGRFFGEMLARGIYLPPSQFEAWFVSAVHSDADVDETIAAVEDVVTRR